MFYIALSATWIVVCTWSSAWELGEKKERSIFPLKKRENFANNMHQWVKDICVCLLCTVRICWPSWRNSHAVGFWQYWMLQAITCDPLIPSFISCSAQALCNPAPPFHPLSFHLITCSECFCASFHFWNSWNLCLPHGDCIVGVCFHSWNSCPESVSSTRSLHCGLWGSFIIMVEGEAVFWICQKTS
jgi:hypothetical protein